MAIKTVRAENGIHGGVVHARRLAAGGERKHQRQAKEEQRRREPYGAEDSEDRLCSALWRIRQGGRSGPTAALCGRSALTLALSRPSVWRGGMGEGIGLRPPLSRRLIITHKSALATQARNPVGVGSS